MAHRKGDRWLSQNAHIIDKIDPRLNAKLIRWDHWEEHYGEKVEQYREMFERAYSLDPHFRAALLADIEGNFQRRFSERDDAFRARHFEQSKAYLIEELAVYSVMFETYPGVKLYPGKELRCFDLLRRQKIEGVPGSIHENSDFVRLGVHQLSAPSNDQKAQPFTSPQSRVVQSRDAVAGALQRR
ncbi:MAG: hypothetical protein AAGH38_00055 [Pseudomonadota bacterium]